MEEDSGPEGTTITKSQDERGAEIRSSPYAFVNDRVEVGIPVDRIQLFGEEHMPEYLDADWPIRLSSLNVPTKYKEFIELTCDDWLPTRAVPGHTDWDYSLECSRCGDKLSIMHWLKECPHASAVWSMSSLSLSVVHQSASTFREFFRDVTRVLQDDEKDVSLFVFICWSLWEAINEYEGQLIAPDPVATLNKALLLLEQGTLLRMDQMVISTNVEQARSGHRRWRPPPKGWLKVNVEAINLKHMMAMGAVVREDNGHALAAMTARYDPEKDGLTAKSVALNRALSHGENGIMFPHQKVVVELTSGLIVECLAEFETARSVLRDEFGQSLESSLSIASRFSEMKFAKVSAQQNRLAYCLASKALLQEWQESWVTFDTPDWLEEAIAADLPD